MDDKRHYDWIILVLFGISAFTRFFMWKYDFQYVDYFIAIVNLVGLDYTATTIIYSINKNINNRINTLDLIQLKKTNKANKHLKLLHICIFAIVLYDIIHLLVFTNSVCNDILSMLVLGISLTDSSIVSYLSKVIKV